MSGELFIAQSSGLSVYRQVKNLNSQRWNGSEFETFIGSDYSLYSAFITEQGASGTYTGDFPTDITTAGHYEILYYAASTPGSAAQGDLFIGTGTVEWSGIEVVEAVPPISATDAGGELLIGNLTGLDVYGQIRNKNSRRWNGTQFEVYTAANFATYAIVATEQGTSGTYVADFPQGITTAGHYEVIFYSRLGASPDESDVIIGTNHLDWTGSRIAEESPVITGAMSGEDWYDYIQRALKRTDKEDEVFDATKDTIDDMRLRIIFPEDETDGDLTDQIAVLGDYRMDLEGDFGHFLSTIILIDSDFGFTLTKISKDEYDRRYGGLGTGVSSRGRPKDFCIYGQKVLVGPVPDSIDYLYKMSYSKDSRGSYSQDTLSIPFTNRYREIERWGVLQRVFSDILKNDDQAAKFGTLYENGLKKIELRLDRNRKNSVETRYRGV